MHAKPSARRAKCLRRWVNALLLQNLKRRIAMVKKTGKSPWVVLIAIALGIVVGHYSGKTTAIFGIPLYSIFEVVGKLFINALTLIVVPLVASSIITGIAKIGNDGAFGRLGNR